MADALNSAKEVIQTADNLVNDIYRVNKAVSKTSVSRLTKDQIFQFPILMDADIDDDEKLPIIKSIEKNYAQLVMTAITNDGMIDRDRYNDINQFLRRFHNNFSGVLEASGEDATMTGIASEGFLPKKDLVDAWKALEDYLDMEPLNSMYRPFDRTTAKLTQALETAHEVEMKRALEADDTPYFRRPEYVRDKNGNLPSQHVIRTDKNGNPVYQYIEAPEVGSPEYNKWVGNYGKPRALKDWHDTDIQSKIADNEKLDEAKNRLEAEKESRRNTRDEEKYRREQADRALSDRRNALGRISGKMEQDPKFNALTPTLLTMTIANTKKDSGNWSQEIKIGVRAMPRMIPQSILIDNMVEACSKNSLVFKFIKWTNGEIKFWDALLGISSSRDSAKSQNRWLQVLRKRAKKSKASGNSLNPNTTIIVTENDVHMIQQKCGVNLHDPTNVGKLMDKYFLLGFGIYDTEGKMLKIMYDGDSGYAMYSLRTMMAEAKKETNLLAMNRY